MDNDDQTAATEQEVEELSMHIMWLFAPKRNPPCEISRQNQQDSVRRVTPSPLRSSEEIEL
ncbi:hypothetical protein [Sinorhizobium fredii]|uniref:hypothetical protein n=1 Tax=Rhizobium fredii TaxID=380 RepID=UPI00339302CF